MARKPSKQQVFADLLARYGQEIADAFRAAIDDTGSHADLQRIIAALQANDIQAAIDAMHLDPAAFGALQDKIAQAYSDGGAAAAEGMPALADATGLKFVVRFDARNVRAEAWLKDHSAQLVTRIIDDQRVSLRSALTAGMERGANPRTVALDIVGRIDRVTGQRTGGIIGLTAQQEQFVETARTELASSDPALLRNYLTRGRRDKRFDRTIQKAIDNGEAPPADIASKALTNYKGQLLRQRGETVGRTEALTSLHAAQDEAYNQAVDQGAISAAQVRSVWRSAADSLVRHTHQILNGESVSHGQPFTSPSGAQMRYPGDTGLGAGPEETVNCRCTVQKRIDFLANVA